MSSPISPYRKKTCTKCFKHLKVHVTCFKCDAVYHAKCLLKVPGFQVDQKGQAFCCRNVTSESDPVEEVLAPQEKLVVVKQEEEYDANKFGLVCSFCNEGNFQGESYEEHIKWCEEYYSGLNKGKDIHLTSIKRKQADVRADERLFKCNKCDYTTKRRHFLTHHILSKHYDRNEWSTRLEYTLERHLRTHVNPKPFKCNRCDYRTALKGSLKAHMKVRHSNAENQQSSPVKPVSIRRKQRPFKCDNCNYAAIWRAHLNDHILARHSNAEKMYKCSDCNYSTHQKSSLAKHMCIHTNERPFKCDICDYAAARRNELNFHIVAKHSNAEKKYKCGDCDYSAHQRSNLVRHTRIHIKERLFQSDACNYAGTSQAFLTDHILAKHSDVEKKYKCSFCEYSTHQKSLLARHICIHTNERPFKCDTCEYSTPQKSNLVKHLRTHTSERPFKCDACEYAATTKALLKHHTLAKHSDAERKYKCGDCEFSAHQKSKLANHRRIHTNDKPFKCDTCDYASFWKNDLNCHVLAKHSNAEKRYKCNDCEYSAHQKSNLLKHVRAHANHRPFTSDTYDYVSSWGNDLNSHILAEHSNAEKTYECGDCK